MTFRFRQFLLATAMPKLCIYAAIAAKAPQPHISITPSIDRNSVNMTTSKIGKRCAWADFSSSLGGVAHLAHGPSLVFKENQ